MTSCALLSFNDTIINVGRGRSDHYVRMSAKSMRGMALEHHFSEVTGTSPCKGFTEWTTQTENALVTVSWDWVRLSNGTIVQPSPRMVFSNLMLLDDYGFDQGADLTEAALLHIIGRIDWRPAVAKACDRQRLGSLSRSCTDGR